MTARRWLTIADGREVCVDTEEGVVYAHGRRGLWPLDDADACREAHLLAEQAAAEDEADAAFVRAEHDACGEEHKRRTTWGTWPARAVAR